MFSRTLYLRILWQVTGIVTVTGSGGALIATGRAYILGSILVGAGLILIGVLVGSLNATNRRILRFLEALQDQEAMAVFPEDCKDEVQRQLYAAFNAVGKQIAENNRESRRQEYFYRALLEHIPDGIISWDASGKIRIVNEAAWRLVDGIPLQHINQLEPFIPDLERVLKEASTTGSVLVKVRTSRHTRQLSVSYKRIVQKEENIFILTLKDIGRELSEKESESWEKLTHVLTHEIMNSIAPIASLSGTLLSYYEVKGEPRSPEEVTDVLIARTIRGLKTVKDQSHTLMHFTGSYRQLSYLQPPTLREFELRSLVDNLHFLLQADLTKRHICLEITFSSEEILLNADQELLSQVLLNLIKNAMQALEEVGGGTIQVNASRTESHVRIDVSDNGPGIATELMEDIFVPFFTTKSTGSGIGLSLSRRIIRMHGGELLVASEPFSETCFTILLPRPTEIG